MTALELEMKYKELENVECAEIVSYLRYFYHSLLLMKLFLEFIVYYSTLNLNIRNETQNYDLLIIDFESDTRKCCI